jgi:CheY-like chemotaxis protein
MAMQLKPILVVEDDPVDREMIELAFNRAAVEHPVVTVSDGQEALDYLNGAGRFHDRRLEAVPVVIVLDLDMPRMNGHEFLGLLKTQPDFALIHTVVLTTSECNQDLIQSYANGANSYITKPGDFEQLIEIAREIGGYWCRINQLPGAK